MASRMIPTALRGQHDTALKLGEDLLGFDLTLLINAFVILGAVSALFHYVGGRLYRWAGRVCLSTVHINEDDKLYAQVMQWMVHHHLHSKRFRSVKATSPNSPTWEDEDAAAAAEGGGGDVGGPYDADRLVSYRSVLNRVPVKLSPFESRDAFRHRGSWIFFSHSVHRNSMLENVMNPRERGYITLRCLGRSLDPLRQLLQEAQQSALDQSSGTTNVFRALTSMRERLQWIRVLSRPSRDIRTVILDRAKKHELLADINEYLHPRSRKWYANHGIPYRRGYLFSGAPGTGKTSLTAALAGVFGLDIYVLSLLDPLLTESQLMRMLSEVPTRCIVLLEDIDAAGLNRPAPADSAAGPEMKRRGARAAAKAAADAPPASLQDAITDAAGLPPSTNPTSEISLSGLLNAIDGVSSHEGRILIMTTNNPESLDRALIRPGRVDMHIAFELPRRPEMRELFVSMYRDSGAQLPATKESAKQNGAAPEAGAKPPGEGKGEGAADEKAAARNADKDQRISDLYFDASAELRELAERFAAALPEGTLSLAAVQGFLLKHKRDPQLAVEQAEQWGREALENA